MYILTMTKPEIDMNEVERCIRTFDNINDFEIYKANINGFYIDNNYMITGTLIEIICKTFKVRIRNITIRDYNIIHILFVRVG